MLLTKEWKGTTLHSQEKQKKFLKKEDYSEISNENPHHFPINLARIDLKFV